MIEFNDTLQKLFKERYYTSTESAPQDAFHRVNKFYD